MKVSELKMKLSKKANEMGFGTIAMLVFFLILAVVILVIIAKQSEFGSSLIEKLKDILPF